MSHSIIDLSVLSTPPYLIKTTCPEHVPSVRASRTGFLPLPGLGFGSLSHAEERRERQAANPIAAGLLPWHVQIRFLEGAPTDEWRHMGRRMLDQNFLPDELSRCVTSLGKSLSSPQGVPKARAFRLVNCQAVNVQVVSVTFTLLEPTQSPYESCASGRVHFENQSVLQFQPHTRL